MSRKADFIPPLTSAVEAGWSAASIKASSADLARLLVNAGVPQPLRAAILDRWAASRGAIVLPAGGAERGNVPPASAAAQRAGLQAAATMAAMLLTASVVVTDRRNPG